MPIPKRIELAPMLNNLSRVRTVSNNQDGAMNSGKRSGPTNYEPTRTGTTVESPSYKPSQFLSTEQHSKREQPKHSTFAKPVISIAA